MQRKILIVMLVFGLLLTACGPATTDDPTIISETEAAISPELEAVEQSQSAIIVIVDDMGVSIELKAYPQAIVSLSASTTEILFAVGAGTQVVGRNDFSLYPEEALELPSIGSLFGVLPSEAILALEPDLVVAAQDVNEDQVQTLRDLGLTVYWQANPSTFEDLWENLRNFATLTGHEDEIESLIAGLDARVKAVQKTVAVVSNPPSVFYELDATDPSNPWTTGSGTFIDYIITEAGGTNAASALEGDYEQISTEALIAINPDVILLADSPFGVSPETVAARSGWEAIAAVIENAVYPIDPNIMSVPGTRLVEGLEVTAKLLHPELFE